MRGKNNEFLFELFEFGVTKRFKNGDAQGSFEKYSSRAQKKGVS